MTGDIGSPEEVNHNHATTNVQIVGTVALPPPRTIPPVSNWIRGRAWSILRLMRVFIASTGTRELCFVAG